MFGEFVGVGDALQAADPHHRMIGIHPMTRHGSVPEFAAARWMPFADYQQKYVDLYGRVLLSRYLRGPVVNSEYGYHLRDADGDGKSGKSNSYSAEDMRFSSWDIVLEGGYLVTGFGTTYFGGNRDPGPFDADAPKNRDWEEQIGHRQRCTRSGAIGSGGSSDRLPQPPDAEDHMRGGAGSWRGAIPIIRPDL